MAVLSLIFFKIKQMWVIYEDWFSDFLKQWYEIKYWRTFSGLASHC